MKIVIKATFAIYGLLWITATLQAFAQSTDMNESRIHRDFRVEKESLASCTRFNFGSIAECGQTLVMGQPMHIAVGSLAPQNGIGAGLAFVEHKHFANELITTWNVDAQATGNGSWRAGAYMKAYRLPSGFTYRAAPLFNFYSQSISLNRVDYFGLGPNTTPLTHTTYGFSENITGVNAIFPLGGALHKKAGLSLVGDVNGRFPSVRPGRDSSLPSVERLFTESNAPGLTHQTAYVEASQGVRFVPILPRDPIRLNYLLQLQEFIAPGDSRYSFRRFKADFSHEIPIYNLFPGAKKNYYTARTPVMQFHGPDDCTAANADRNISKTHAAAAKVDPARPCPIISTTDKLEGSITLRAVISESIAGRGSVVPFYLSPTLGGSDVNGTAMLASYPDYRFRGPDLLLFRGTVEHSIGKLPLGAIFSLDAAKIGMRRDDISLDHLRHTYSAGLTVHAGGLPLIFLTFGWGGHEGTHTSVGISPVLLGSSSRPSLF